MPTESPVFRMLSSALMAKRNCLQSGNLEWFERWDDRIAYIVKNYLPSGAGFDCGTSINEDKSTRNRLVFTTKYHHMNESGMYDGWTQHAVIVTPSFEGISVRVTGCNRNDIKDYIEDVFYNALTSNVRWED